jgi:hypothetical protein
MSGVSRTQEVHRALVCAVLGLAVLTLVVAGGARAAGPSATRVSLQVPADSQIVISKVAVENGTAWFAVAFGRELRIFRWHGDHWALDGTVDLPATFPAPGELGGDIQSTSITGSDAPDFEVFAEGADTPWFAIAAHIDGRWNLVPFDDEFGSRHSFTIAYGVEDGLLHGSWDACSCATGPTTDQWYRFADGFFTATNPPGVAATCSAAALAAAGHWPPLPDDPLLRNVAHPFHAVRFACEGGWALASDGHDVAVYEQHGPQVISPTGHDWLRVGVGTPHLLGTAIEYALPRSLLDKLGGEIGMRFPAAKPVLTPGPTEHLSVWQRAPITVRIGPGDSFSETDMFGSRPQLLTVTIGSHAAGRTVTQFRWRNGRWVPV